MRVLASVPWKGCPRVARPAAGAALALVAALGCDLPHPASPDPNWVGIASLLEVGEREAYILARYFDHFGTRLGPAEPAIAVSLEGPGWTVPLADAVVTDLQWNCGPLGAFDFDLEKKGDVCLRGTLPEAIRSGVEYRLSGVTEHGPFTGQTVVPQPPVLLEPESDTALFRAWDIWDADELWVPVRYRFGPDVGTRVGEMGGTITPFRTTILVGAESGRVRFDPDTIVFSPDPVAVPVPMRLAGLGWNYTRFVENTGSSSHDLDHFLVLRPWPETGIKGEGVYGYFDGVSFSRTVTVVVEFDFLEEDGPGP